MRCSRSTLTLALFALSACPASGGTDDMSAGDGGVPGPCVPGQSMACECEDGSSGARVCAPEGDGYGACACEGDDAAADDGSGGADDGVDDGMGTGAGDDGLPGDDGTPADDDGGIDDGPPTWSGFVVPFLEQYCGANNATCHRREAYTAIVDKGCLGWASFEDVPLGSLQNGGETPDAPTGCPDLDLYDRLVERSPWQCGAFNGSPSEMLIVPGDSDASYMIKKMTGQLMCDDSDPMPPPDSMIVVPEAQMQRLREWIDAGAVMD